jgi:membrane protein involved in colicin uptake
MLIMHCGCTASYASYMVTNLTLVLIPTHTHYSHLCAQATQNAPTVKASAEQKAAQKQAKADTTTAKEPAEEPSEEPDVGGQEDSDDEEEGSAAEVSGQESSDDGDETDSCEGCGNSRSIGKVTGSFIPLQLLQYVRYTTKVCRTA